MKKCKLRTPHPRRGSAMIIAGILLTSHLTFSQQLDNTFELSDVDTLSQEGNIEYIVSPNYSKVLMWDGKNDALFISETKEIRKGKIEKEAVDWRGGQYELAGAMSPVWGKDNKTVFWESKEDDVCASCLLKLNTTADDPTLQAVDTKIKNLGTLAQMSSGLETSETRRTATAYLNKKTQSIEAAYRNAPSQPWVVSSKPAEYYNLITSPDGKKIVCNVGADMVVFGIEKDKPFEKNLGVGVPSAWDPSSKFIMYFIDEGDGHETSVSNLYIIGIDGQNRSLLTKDNSNKIFTDPQWISSGDILFKEQTTGKTLTGKVGKIKN